MPSDELRFAREFKLSITKALGDQLLETLAATEETDLSATEILKLAPRPGVYELFYDNGMRLERIYVGKASKDLGTRLMKHFRKISGRRDISMSDMKFKCAYVDEDLDASAPEKMLINRYKAQEEIPWNNNGFGNNDPGRNRDRSMVKANHFDALFPVDLDHVPTLIKVSFEEGMSVLELLQNIKRAFPFNLRFPNPAKLDFVKKSELMDSPVFLNGANPADLTADEWLELTIQSLPEGWQASILPGYVILYREVAEYKSARWYWRKIGGVSIRIPGPSLLATDGVIEDINNEHEE